MRTHNMLYSRLLIFVFIHVMFLGLFIKPVIAQKRSAPLIVDHTCLDISQIPMNWIDSAMVKFNLHFAHSSHGEQLIVGLKRIENYNSVYNFEIENCSIPSATKALRFIRGTIINGQCDIYITAGEYWNTQEGMNATREMLRNNPEINLSTWTFCTEHRGNPDDYGNIQPYLDAMNQLEQEFPNVTFIYMTGHGGTYYGHHSDSPTLLIYGLNGFWASINNARIRKYCQDNNKVLFDFGDIDCWWFNQNTKEWECGYSKWENNTYPREHDHYNIDEAAHTSFENCENKGKAMWWLMASLAGWQAKSLPVIMSNIEAIILPGHSVLLKWDTGTEMNCFGFHIWRSQFKDNDYQKITDNYVPGHGTCTNTNSYSYLDQNLTNGVTYWYKIEEIGSDGSNEFYGPISIEYNKPTFFRLYQNFPNPFNPATQINYQLLENSKVSLQIFNLGGEEIMTLIDGMKTKGLYTIRWDGKSEKGIRVPAGIYYARLLANQYSEVIKLILVN